MFQLLIINLSKEQKGSSMWEIANRDISGENVSIEFEVDTKVELGKFSIKIPMFVFEISDNCLLG